jgi:8-oxo-dGTP pyrophosphatase MutT (NUDIX family)
MDVELGYGAMMVPIDSEKRMVLIKHTYDLVGISENNWTIPGGKLEPSEKFDDAAIRETFEETGMRCEITDLYKVFHFIHLRNGEKIAEWYGPVFIGNIVEETECNNTREIKETRRFTELPTGFAGELYQYYDDLMTFIKDI